DTSQGMYDTTPFAGQVLTFGLSKAYQMSLKTLFDICRSMHAWLSLDTANVAVIHCTNGVGRTGVAIACYFRYAELFDDCMDAFDYFVYRRTPDDTSWVTVSQRRYVQYFNNVLLLGGSLPSPYPLKLHRIIINGIPNFDNAGSCNPGVEIYQTGKLVYSSVIANDQITTGNSRGGLNRQRDSDSEDDTAPVYKDEYGAVFRIPSDHPLTLEKDIQVRIFHCPDPMRNPSQVITMINFSFHTGFMPSGLIRVAAQDLELARRDVDEGRFPSLSPSSSSNNNANGAAGDFCVDFVFTEVVPAQDPKTAAEMGLRPISYRKWMDRNLLKCLAKCISYHHVKVDEGLMRQLEEMGVSRLLAAFALQRTENQLPEAHDYVALLLQSASPEAASILKAAASTTTSPSTLIDGTITPSSSSGNSRTRDPRMWSTSSGVSSVSSSGSHGSMSRGRAPFQGSPSPGGGSEYGGGGGLLSPVAALGVGSGSAGVRVRDSSLSSASSSARTPRLPYHDGSGIGGGGGGGGLYAQLDDDK
ncbi:hypothetical protein HK102_009192, partial [Quaeritorhiza haematococci]